MQECLPVDQGMKFEGRCLMGRTIQALELLRDFNAGLPMERLGEKYGLPRDRIVDAIRQIFREREAETRQIAEDVKSGISMEELVTKYRLTEDRLCKVLKMLVDGRYLSRKQVPGCYNFIQADSVVVNIPEVSGARPKARGRIPGGRVPAGDSVFLDLRSVARVKLPNIVRVQFGTDPGNTCTLRDVCEHGLGLRGVRGRFNERTILRVLGDDWGEVAPFECDGACRWTDDSSTPHNAAAGFMITRISDVDFHHLQSLIGHYAHARH